MTQFPQALKVGIGEGGVHMGCPALTTGSPVHLLRGTALGGSQQRHLARVEPGSSPPWDLHRRGQHSPGRPALISLPTLTCWLGIEHREWLSCSPVCAVKPEPVPVISKPSVAGPSHTNSGRSLGYVPGEKLYLLTATWSSCPPLKQNFLSFDHKGQPHKKWAAVMHLIPPRGGNWENTFNSITSRTYSRQGWNLAWKQT